MTGVSTMEGHKPAVAEDKAAENGGFPPARQG